MRLSEVLGETWILGHAAELEELLTSVLEVLARGCATRSRANPDGLIERSGHVAREDAFAEGLGRLLKLHARALDG